MPQANLFGTSGIRGLANILFTPVFCYKIGRVFATFLNNHHCFGSVSIGIDSRQSSPNIAKFITQGLNKEGREVTYLGVIPVPAANLSIINGGFVGSIMVTGSHIDMNSNGVKFFFSKEEIDKDQELEIENIFAHLPNDEPPIGESSHSQNSDSGVNNYLEHLLSITDLPNQKLKIVFDPGNGGQTECISTYFRETGFNFVPIQAHLQDPLISRDTEVDGSFKILQETVLSEKADLGVGFDSDGDRVVFVDHTGIFVNGDYSGSLIAQHFAADSVVVPINVSNVVNYLGKQIFRTKVGSPHVIQAMHHFDSLVGFESNGGVIHADTMYSRDGGTTMVKMLNILKWTKKPLADLIGSLPHFILLKIKLDCPTDRYQQIYNQTEKYLHPKSIDKTDGVKLILDDSTWVLFRGSGNAPEFRVFVESNTATKANQLLADSVNFVKKIINV